MKPIDITGKKFGKLTALYRDRAKGKSWWACVCDCGNTCSRIGSYLRKGSDRTSCGCTISSTMKRVCLSDEAKERLRSNGLVHGFAKRSGASPEYKTWLNMKMRCYYPKCSGYPYYGARGINVCDEWKDDFPQFLSDMGNRPSPSHTIDRINQNGNYEKQNCRWVEREKQGQENNRNLIQIKVCGIEFFSIAAASRHFNIGQRTVRARLKKGVNIDEAFTTPVKNHC